MIPHFFVSPADIAGDEARLDADDTRHLVTVLRARPGHDLTISDGAGTVWQAKYRGDGESGRAAVSLLDPSQVPRQRPAITVVHALPKQRKLDEVVQRLTEVGVDRIVPVHSARSQVELDERRAAKAVARWRAVALAAAKQSKRAYLPVVDPVGQWTDVFDGSRPGVVLWEDSDVALRHVLAAIESTAEVVVAIGPEGGLDAGEVSATNLPHASLGPTVLRTETAALVAVAALRYHFGLMEPT